VQAIDLASIRHVSKSVLALVLILLLVAGLAIGFALASRYWTQKPVGLSYPHRGDTTRESSLRDYLALLDVLQAGDPSDVARKAYGEGRALLLMRLADSAEQRGSLAESTGLTSDALAVCSTAGLPYCSSVELRQRAHKLDVILERVKQSD
jgi:hypothetical protein